MTEHEQTHRPIPLARTTHGLLRVTAEIEGQPAALLVDTGAGGTVIDETSAKRLGLTSSPSEERATGAFESSDVSQVDVDSFRLASTELGKHRLHVADLSHVNGCFEQMDERIDGVLGADILAPRKAVIEYSGPQLKLGP